MEKKAPEVQEKTKRPKLQLKKLHKRLEVCQHFDMLITFTFAHDHNQHLDDDDDDKVTVPHWSARQPTDLTN